MRQLWPFLGVLCLTLIAQGSAFGHETHPPAEERPRFRFQFDNDGYFTSDNLYSTGWSFQKHSRFADSRGAVRGTPAFGKILAKPFLPRRKNGRVYRESFALGQTIVTPEEISRSDLIEDDVPYGAFLGIANSWIAFDESRFTGFGMTLGLVGPAALGEFSQRLIHGLTNSEVPNGWDNQLENEPIVNFTYMGKRRLWRTRSFDGAINADAALGNMFVVGDVSLETRLGINLPKGFGGVPDPIGRSLTYDALLPPEGSRPYTFYLSMTLRASAWGRSIFIDGNTFRDSHDLAHAREEIVAQAILGLHYRRARWGLHVDVFLSSNALDPDIATPDTDVRNNYIAVAGEWSF